jgi:Raf kinase inhibitor-like YbhB/YbcL family protein
MALTLTSDAFGDGHPIPQRYSCDGEGVSPPLTWSPGPVGTASYALIVDDPDAPGGVFTHWVLYDLPPDVRTLPAGLRAGDRFAEAGAEGKNDFGQLGYGGPCPPRGSQPHRYRFTVYAVNAMLGLPPGATKQQTLDALRDHILETGHLSGTYQRPG